MEFEAFCRDKLRRENSPPSDVFHSAVAPA